VIDFKLGRLDPPECLLSFTFHCPIDTLPLCCVAELLRIGSFSFVLVCPGNDTLGRLCSSLVQSTTDGATRRGDTGPATLEKLDEASGQLGCLERCLED